MNFNYKYRDPKKVVPKWKFPRVHITSVTFHPWEILHDTSKEVKLSLIPINRHGSETELEN